MSEKKEDKNVSLKLSGRREFIKKSGMALAAGGVLGNEKVQLGNSLSSRQGNELRFHLSKANCPVEIWENYEGFVDLSRSLVDNKKELMKFIDSPELYSKSRGVSGIGFKKNSLEYKMISLFQKKEFRNAVKNNDVAHFAFHVNQEGLLKEYLPSSFVDEYKKVAANLKGGNFKKYLENEENIDTTPPGAAAVLLWLALGVVQTIVVVQAIVGWVSLLFTTMAADGREQIGEVGRRVSFPTNTPVWSHLDYYSSLIGNPEYVNKAYAKFIEQECLNICNFISKIDELKNRISKEECYLIINVVNSYYGGFQFDEAVLDDIAEKMTV